MNTKHIKRRFTLMQFLLWFTFGTFGIFFVAYLKDYGYSSKFIAMGLTLSTLVGIGGQYLVGYISDLTSKIKTIFLISLAILIATVSFFMFFAQNSFLVIVFMILYGMSWMPLESLLDSWILSTDDLPHSEYGSIRSGGSLGFSIITVFFGSLIIKYGFRVSPIAFLISGSLLFLVAFMTKTHTTKKPTSMGLKEVRLLFSNKRYTAILIFSILIFVGHMGINNFYIYIVSNIGSDESLIGISASAAAITEVLGFYLGTKLQRKFNPLHIMIFVAIGSFFRVYFLTQAQTATGILITGVMQGFFFSIFLGTFKVYISEITPLSLLASAQSVASSTYFGLASIIANIIGGILIDDYGINAFYRVLITISAISVLYIILVYLITRKNIYPEQTYTP